MTFQERFLRRFFLFFFGAGLALLLARLYVMWGLGGTSWQQADWLISFADGPIRRGLSGELFLWLSSVSGLSVVTILCMTQAVLVVLLFWGIASYVVRAGAPVRVILMVFSPAFLLFWVHDPFAGFRKEILGFIAFLPLMSSAAGRMTPRIAIGLSVLIYVVAVAFHEVNAFLAPFLLAGFALCLPKEGRLKRLGVLGAALAVVGGGSLGFAIAFPTASSAKALCDPVVAAGASQEICTGIFEWLVEDMAWHREIAQAQIARWTPMVSIFSYLVVFLPIAIVISAAPYWRKLTAVFWLSALPILPLYAVSVDWGRWMALHVTALFLLGLIALQRVQPAWAFKPLHPLALAVCLCINLFYGFFHVNAKPLPGAAIEIVRVIIDPTRLIAGLDTSEL